MTGQWVDHPTPVFMQVVLVIIVYRTSWVAAWFKAFIGDE